MSLSIFSCLLAVSDVAAVVTLSASMRNGSPKLIDITFAIVRCALVLVAIGCFSDYSKGRLVIAAFTVLAVASAFLGYNDDQGEAHAKIDFLVSLGFGLVEGLILMLSYSLSVDPSTPKATSDVLRESLLEEGNTTRATQSQLDDVVVDSYKGQGASFRRLLSLAYPERYILAVASLALFVSSAASVVTPAVSFSEFGTCTFCTNVFLASYLVA
jgi:hypothetical protein